MRAFKKQNVGTIDLQFIQDNVDDALRGLIATTPILDGNLIEGIVIVSGTLKTVNHNLGRNLIGFMITRKSANAVIWDSQATNKNPSKTLELNASANVTISIWAF